MEIWGDTILRNKCRYQGNASTGQGTLQTVSNNKKLKQAWTSPFSWVSESINPIAIFIVFLFTILKDKKF